MYDENKLNMNLYFYSVYYLDATLYRILILGFIIHLYI